MITAAVTFGGPVVFGGTVVDGTAFAQAAPRTPDLARATTYLTSAARLVHGHYYESFPGFADYGLTIDGALALAASGRNDAALQKVVAFLKSNAKDSGGQTINGWTGIGTGYVSGGSLGKEALLAQVTGYDPKHFAGKNVLSALDATVCARASVELACAAAGNYAGASSVFAQSLAVIAQLRAHHTAQAAAPIKYLESLQHTAHTTAADKRTAGAWPSLIPGTGSDVDSTAVAVMALTLAAGARSDVTATKAAAAAKAGLAWLAGQQSPSGGFPGVAADSTNSTGLAIQAFTLAGSTYAAQVASARAFLAARQNSDGGFDVSATDGGSDVRASAQAVSGAVGTSFGTLARDVRQLAPAPSATPTATRTPTTAPPSTPRSTVTASSTPTARPTVRSSAGHSSTAAFSTAGTTAVRPPTVLPATRQSTTRLAITPTTTSTRTTARPSTSTYAAAARQPTVSTGAGAASTVLPSVPETSAAVAGAGAGSAELANTGSRISTLAALAAALVGLGASLSFAGRRRRRPAAPGRHR